MTVAADPQTCISDGTPSGPVTGRHRLAHAAWSAAVIAALGWWSWYSDPDPSLPEIMANSQSFEGQEIKIGDEPIIESTDTNSFVISCRGFRLRVAGSVSPNDIGRYVYVRGTFRRPSATDQCDAVIRPAEHYVARGRHAKIWISVIPSLWIAALLLLHFRLNTTHWSLEPRS